MKILLTISFLLFTSCTTFVGVFGCDKKCEEARTLQRWQLTIPYYARLQQ
jgi:hypothetical protein